MTTSRVAGAAAGRCAAHPSRPAVDRCPACARPRCGADVRRGGRCPVCAPRSLAGGRRDAVRLIRTGLATYPVTLVGAWIATQYVHTHVFALVVPALVGVGCAAAATAAAGRGGMAVPLAVAVPAALVAVGLADRFVAGGGISAVSPAAQAGPPYLAAVAGAVGWTVLSRPSGGPGGRGRAG